MNKAILKMALKKASQEEILDIMEMLWNQLSDDNKKQFHIPVS